MQENAFDAVVFDLDGVITGTASVHSAAWKQMFDEYLRRREAEHGEPFREFTHTGDYLPFVDGKPRYKGVASFLESRGIDIPFGDPDDTPDQETACGLGNRKNELFNAIIASGGAEVFDTSVDLIRDLKNRGIRIGVASSSKNCKTILESTGLLPLFETRVDGVVSAELGLHGKPEPDIFTVASDNLGVNYDRTVVVEDAVSGVQAGAAGNFGLVLGVAREDNAQELRANGADIVVSDLGEIDFDGLSRWFMEGLEAENWLLRDTEHEPELETTREALLTIGNGYFGTRGAQEECSASDLHYPGTYIAGVYNRLTSHIAGRDVVNEDFVNCTNWLPISFRVDGGEWFTPTDWELVEFSRHLDLRRGVLSRSLHVRDAEGRETRVESQRFASMADPHMAAMRYAITPLNYAGTIAVRSMLDGEVVNAGVARYSDLANRHLEPVEAGGSGATSWVATRTSQSGIEIAVAAKLAATLDDEALAPEYQVDTVPAVATTVFEQAVIEGATLAVDKLVGIFTSADDAVGAPLAAARESIEDPSFETAGTANAEAWESIWNRIDIRLEGDRLSQKLLRLHLYHSMITASPHTAALDVGIPARGLHGEAYRGHIFWDELFILPLYNLHYPETAKATLLYRHRRLDKARDYAREHGYAGAMYPWQSGSDGSEETQVVHLNPVSGEWGDDYSALQRHVSLAIPFGAWEYYWTTGDVDFLCDYGAEMFIELARFWSSIAARNEATGRYDIAGVMGPDEFHEKPPGATHGGLKNNSYTNIMAAWLLRTTATVLELIGDDARASVVERTGLGDDEAAHWADVAAGLTLCISDDGVLEQFEGYFDLEELDWDAYREKYGAIGRMDRLLKAEGKSPDGYKVAKQADALMPFYVFLEHEVAEIVASLGYPARDGMLAANLDYYLPRTSHGSTLSRLVHAHVANRAGHAELSWQLYEEALHSDYADTQGGTTKEGIHAGVMAGTVLLALVSYAGLDVTGPVVSLAPRLPAHWRAMRFNIGFRGQRYFFEVDQDVVRVRGEEGATVNVGAETVTLRSGHWTTVNLQ
ncbi:MAG: HAD-IA family hydrolase [Woeseiaceae bacterium]|nr:HAD-IA family hydrolase [Woeseiaceae bacterium]